ncbi:class II fructose-bisphosphatase [Hansschlegelia quercus]|uniref:Fructose-1,6-bisphosphatase n=1 Tax=Hansschlegelia quercus TaxID=2528245 RepID=A0A4Q9GIT3_9HYPH|nr:class II fructose-bisphosphatase [Hansschlegelia quercus]TBN54169.1 class II fructose-bisphosphatase [Hansschlegelia quercus]
MAKNVAARRNVVPLRRSRGGPLVTHHEVINRALALELVRVTEHAAVAAARLRGRGDEMAADKAAVDAMRRELNQLAIHGTVVIGEGERDQAPMLFIGEEVGDLSGPRVDIALDPLEGATLCAKGQPNAIAVIAMAQPGSLLNAPDCYMDKVAIGPGYAEGIVSLDASPAENIYRLAKAKGVAIDEITACILDRPRHAKLIAAVRATGAAVRLITDGDVAAVIDVTDPAKTGVDIYLGVGGAPEGVLAAAALKCMGGRMQGRLILDTPESRRRAEAMGIDDFSRVYDVDDMASGNVLFAATGVTTGGLLAGVRFGPQGVTTDTIVMRSSTGTLRRIRAEHGLTAKFSAD